MVNGMEKSDSPKSTWEADEQSEHHRGGVGGGKGRREVGSVRGTRGSNKIVRAAVVAILTPIYGAEFLGFSYGFRPGRSQHDALDALAYGIQVRKINWILDADISKFFDSLSLEWLIRFVEHRIGDRRIIRLIQKWLKAGVLEDGHLIETTERTRQGAVASPLLANVYLHYVYDLRVQQWRARHAKGDMVVVRYAEGPWGGGPSTLHGGTWSSQRPDSERDYRQTRCARETETNRALIRVRREQA
jgi:hypothetical protein